MNDPTQPASQSEQVKPISAQLPFVTGPVTVGAQSVLFNNNIEDLKRSVASLARAAELAMASGLVCSVTLGFGDSSPNPCLSDADIEALRLQFGRLLSIEYDFFGTNLGSAAGHNRLAAANIADFFLIQNPDVIVAPRLLEILTATFRAAGVGMVEAKQLPIEHPKDYDPATGETAWATTACSLIPAVLFRKIGGFDAGSFFLYCDDVDYSWRTRLEGYKIIFQPAAIAFHDKRVSNAGQWQPSEAEKYYSAEAALFLAHKWSRQDVLKKHIRNFLRSGDANMLKAVDVFEKRRTAGGLARPIDAEHRVGSFDNGFYAKHRYAL